MPDHIQPVFTAGPIPPDVARRVALVCAAQGRDVAERREGTEDFPGRWGAGRSCVDVIQAAAVDAAAELSRLRGVVEAVRALADTAGLVSGPFGAPFPAVSVAALTRALASVPSSGESETDDAVGDRWDGTPLYRCPSCGHLTVNDPPRPCAACEARTPALVPSSGETGERARRYDQCDDTCTTDCGHCKGQGRPASPEPTGADEGQADGEAEALADALFDVPILAGWSRSFRRSLAGAILDSDWLARRDAPIRAEALREAADAVALWACEPKSACPEILGGGIECPYEHAAQIVRELLAGEQS